MPIISRALLFDPESRVSYLIIIQSLPEKNHNDPAEWAWTAEKKISFEKGRMLLILWLLSWRALYEPLLKNVFELFGAVVLVANAMKATQIVFGISRYWAIYQIDSHVQVKVKLFNVLFTDKIFEGSIVDIFVYFVLKLENIF